MTNNLFEGNTGSNSGGAVSFAGGLASGDGASNFSSNSNIFSENQVGLCAAVEQGDMHHTGRGGADATRCPSCPVMPKSSSWAQCVLASVKICRASCGSLPSQTTVSTGYAVSWECVHMCVAMASAHQPSRQPSLSVAFQLVRDDNEVSLTVLSCSDPVYGWRFQVQGSGASGGALELYQVAVATVLNSVFDNNYADTQGGGLDAIGYNDSTLLVQGSRHV